MANYIKTEVELSVSNEGTRNDVRMRVVEQLSKEPERKKKRHGLFTMLKHATTEAGFI